MSGFLSLDELDGDEVEPTSPDGSQTPPGCPLDPSQCFSPNSAQKAVLEGAITAVNEHRSSVDANRRRRSETQVDNKTTVAAVDESEPQIPEDEESQWVRSQSGEHSLDARNEIYLQSEWDIYFDGGSTRGMSDQDWENRVKKIGSFDSVQLFWRYWNNLPFAQLPIGSSMRFFKTGIEPNWDDPQNQNGGKWVLKPTQAPEQLFSDVTLALIGGAFPSAASVCGVIYSIKPKGVVLSIWNSDASDKTQVNAIAHELRQMCNLSDSGVLQYMDHKGTMKFNETIRQKAKHEDGGGKNSGKKQKNKKGSAKESPRMTAETHSTTVLPLPLPKPAVPKASTPATTKSIKTPAAQSQPTSPLPKPQETAQKSGPNDVADSKPPIAQKGVAETKQQTGKKEKPVPKPKGAGSKSKLAARAADARAAAKDKKGSVNVRTVQDNVSMAVGALVVLAAVAWFWSSWGLATETIIDDEV